MAVVMRASSLTCSRFFPVLSLKGKLGVPPNKVRPLSGELFPIRSHCENLFALLALGQPAGQRSALFGVLPVL
jgi:hypothetical protein